MAQKKKVENIDGKEEKKKKSLGLKLLLMLLILGVLGGAGFFGYNYFMEQQQNDEDFAPPSERQERPANTVMVELEPFVVNLADPLGRRYLRTAIEVEAVNRRAADDLQANRTQVRDAILLLLSSKTFEDLRTMERKIQLRNEIVERINQIIGQNKVYKVYFTEFVVQ